MRLITVMLALLILSATGCANPVPIRHANRSIELSSNSPPSRATRTRVLPAHDAVAKSEKHDVVAANYVAPSDDAAEEVPADPISEPLQLDDVIQSVYRSYPLLEAALFLRDTAFGENLAAQGAFDLKLKGGSENGPLGFYKTYRQQIGFEQPTYAGGSVFGGYRIGRGNFQPWYGERQTDDGGEFKAGVSVPLARNVTIDPRRAELWRTNLDRQLAEPEIRMQQIDFVRAASYAYWDWVAGGRYHQTANQLLEIDSDRNDAIRRKVQTGDTEPPVLEDNRRMIVSREAKLVDARRKLQQTAVKLSLYYRDVRGEPVVVKYGQLADFTAPQTTNQDALPADIETALENRPELLALKLRRQQLQVDLNEARNELMPDIQAFVAGSQDVGADATSKNDKSDFELEAGFLMDVPVQRRKARGKMTAIESKLAQLAAKQRMTADKVVADVRSVYAELLAANQQIERALESVELADRLAEIERRKFDLGESDLLSVNIREQQAAEAQIAAVDALHEYFTTRADYRAVLARD